MTVRWMNVYPAYTHHDFVAIVGDQQALQHLGERLLAAAAMGAATAICFATDGEGYAIEVLRVDDIEERDDIIAPYVAEFAGGPVLPTQLPDDLLARMSVYKRAKP